MDTFRWLNSTMTRLVKVKKVFVMYGAATNVVTKTMHNPTSSEGLDTPKVEPSS